jgi:hypothetical protein
MPLIYQLTKDIHDPSIKPFSCSARPKPIERDKFSRQQGKTQVNLKEIQIFAANLGLGHPVAARKSITQDQLN